MSFRILDSQQHVTALEEVSALSLATAACSAAPFPLFMLNCFQHSTMKKKAPRPQPEVKNAVPWAGAKPDTPPPLSSGGSPV
jgi:hypothetical protein